MNIIKLELRKKTVDQKIPLGQNHINAMSGNATYPTATRMPTDAQYQAAQDALVATNAAADAAETAWRAAILERDNAEAAWDAATTARGSNCEAVTPGNRAALQTTGLPLRSLPGPVGVLPAPINFLANPGPQAGDMTLSWKAVRGAVSYITECKEHDTPQPWAQVKLSTSSRIVVSGLTPGKIYAFRVRALGAEGEGPWSDETVRMAA